MPALTRTRTTTAKRVVKVEVPDGANTPNLWRVVFTLASHEKCRTSAHDLLRRMLLRERERLRRRLGPARADQIERDYCQPPKAQESASKGPPDRADTFVD